jgi:hypothetical protein
MDKRSWGNKEESISVSNKKFDRISLLLGKMWCCIKLLIKLTKPESVASLTENYQRL